MSDRQELPRVPSVDPSLVRWTHVIYGLHAIAVIVGVASAAATVAGGFVFGLASAALTRGAELGEKATFIHKPRA